jgi:hypothetical protein
VATKKATTQDDITAEAPTEETNVKTVKLTSPAGTKVTAPAGDLVDALKAQGWK